MIISEKLRSTNRAEYILYMWQVEDLLRAYNFDVERLTKEYISQFKLSDEEKQKMAQWYADLSQMMLSEGLRTKGHLQIIKNTLSELEELHNKLLQSEKFPYYRQMYYKVLPYIVELRSKTGTQKGSGVEQNESTELETLFNALYGTLLLRLQHKEISAQTTQATGDISTFLGQLSDYYFKDKQKPIEF